MSTATVSYEPVIGFEVHVELSTRTKVWCGCPTTFGAPPNTQVCPICLGMPGSLPVLNRQAMEYAIRTAIALNCTIPERTAFDRKNYYYPDLPKNYQISQQYSPLGTDGWVDLEVGGQIKRVRINNIHLEEDAGKLLHPDGGGLSDDYSMVDLNRAGTPLLEIVSEPDLGTAEEAQAYMSTLKNLLEYLEVSDCKMQEGRLRFEVNISVRETGIEKLGTKVEIKNLNSMKTALRCIEYETRRQSQMVQRGERVLQETRLWDEPGNQTRAMRSKEVANDYRYFPDPDLVEVRITQEWKESIRHNLPELQDAKRKRFIDEYELPEYNARVLTATKPVADYYEQAVKAHKNPKALSNWMMTEILREIKERDCEPAEIALTPVFLASLVRLIDEGKISSKIAKDVFAKAMAGEGDPAAIVEREGLSDIRDAGEIELFVNEAIAENPDMVAKIQAGQTKTIQALVGQIMKKSRGKANPAVVNQLIVQKLGL